jgi:hypothetical protein
MPRVWLPFTGDENDAPETEKDRSENRKFWLSIAVLCLSFIGIVLHPEWVDRMGTIWALIGGYWFGHWDGQKSVAKTLEEAAVIVPKSVIDRKPPSKELESGNGPENPASS